jgi:hypothetical protein
LNQQVGDGVLEQWEDRFFPLSQLPTIREEQAPAAKKKQAPKSSTVQILLAKSPTGINTGMSVETPSDRCFLEKK